MRSVFQVMVALLMSTAIVPPSETSAQSVCEGFTTVLEAMGGGRRSKQKLEFLTLPGATCEFGGSEYTCDWSKPRASDAIGAPYREWFKSIMKDVKRFAGKFQQCIDQGDVPFEWGSFRKDRNGGVIQAYYVYTRRNPKLSVVFCVRDDDNTLPEGEEHLGASLRVVIHRGHEDYCF